jgi:WD40-like Beta Propeller Repeat
VTRWREPAPDEHDAGDRTWEVVRRAYEERLPATRRRDWRMVAAVAAGVAILAAAFSPPGLAVLGSLRDAVRGESNARPVLAALPGGGRLLTESADGVWVVQRDGSKRLLAGYHDASWSPHGKYIAAVRGNELRALEPSGQVHWSLGRVGPIRDPRWSYEGFRIAYFARGRLRVVNGDGTNDHLLTRNALPGVLAWQPGTHSLAYVNRAGNIVVQNVDLPRSPAHIRTRLSPRALQWTPDRRIVAVGPHAIGIFAPRGPQLSRFDVEGRIATASVSPDGSRIAFVEVRNKESTVQVDGQTIFKGAGAITNLAWSPDGRWLLLDWTSADQWLFIRRPVKKLIAVSNIRVNFGDESTLRGWCCP